MMHANPDSHPTAEQLAAFDAGCLPAGDREAIEQHVAGCARCCRTLETLPEDSLAALVRAYNSTAVVPGLDDGSHTWNVPVELVGHPRYRVLGVLGRGGMGVVYKAIHQRMDRVVALKVIHPELAVSSERGEGTWAARPGFGERFRLETRALARLSHPNIATAYDADQAGSLHFLVMEHVEGISLEHLVRQQGRLGVDEACDAVRQAALGLEHAHQRGLVHRDVKPSNLLRMAGGQVKIIDFGLARLLWSEKDAREGTSPPVLGTPDYIAPEQARDPASAGTRSDIYSLGCTLYHLLAGQPPFPGGTALQKLLWHQERIPRPIKERRNDVPDWLAGLIERMLAKDPARRPQTAAAVAHKLADQSPEVVAHPPRRRWPYAVVLGVVALGVAGMALWPRQPNDPPEQPEQPEQPVRAGQPVQKKKDDRASAADISRWKKQGRDRVLDWWRANNRWGSDALVVKQSMKDVDTWLERKDGFQWILGPGLVKSARPTILAMRLGTVFHFDLDVPPDGKFPVEGRKSIRQWFRQCNDPHRRQPRVELSNLKIENAGTLPAEKGVLGTVAYRRTADLEGSPELRLLYHHGAARTMLIFYLNKQPLAEKGVIQFKFGTLKEKNIRAYQPQVVFIELASRHGDEGIIESNTLAEVVWPRWKKPE